MAQFTKSLSIDGQDVMFYPELYNLVHASSGRDNGTGLARTGVCAPTINWQQFAYNRASSVPTEWLRNYIPFQIIGKILSASFKGINSNMPKGYSFAIRMHKSSATAENPYSNQLAEALVPSVSLNSAITGATVDTHYLCPISILHATTSEEFAYCKDKIEQSTGSVHQQIYSAMLMPDPTFNVLCYSRPDPTTDHRYPKGFYVIVVNKISADLFHRLVGLLPILFGIDMNQLQNFTADLPKLFEAFVNHDADTFIAEATTYLLNYNNSLDTWEKDQRARRFSRVFDGMETRMYNNMRNYATRQVESVQRNISDKESALTTLYRNLRDLQCTLYADADDSKISRFVEFLKKVPAIQGINMGNDLYFYFGVEVILSNYEPKEAANVVRRLVRERTSPTKAHILQALFINEAYQVVIRDGFYLNLTPGARDNLYGHHDPYNIDTVSTEADALHNPHLTYYNCWGDNGPYIGKALINGDYDTAFNQALSAVRSLNLLDGTVIDKFIRDLTTDTYQNYTCIIRVSDKQRLSCRAFLKEIETIQLEGAGVTQ